MNAPTNPLAPLASLSLDRGEKGSSSARHGGITPRRALWLWLVNWSFALFSTTRLLTYLPTLWAIHCSADSSQHSLLTWIAWVGSNLSMAAWLYENNGQRINKAIVVTLGNAVMCSAVCALIVFYRWP